jgi:hypothetical protein
MQRAKASAGFCSADADAELEEAVLVCVAVEPSCATRRAGELPQPPATSARPDVARTPAAIRALIGRLDRLRRCGSDRVTLSMIARSDNSRTSRR